MCHCLNRRQFLISSTLTASSLAGLPAAYCETEVIPEHPLFTFGTGQNLNHEKQVKYMIYGPTLPAASLKALKNAVQTVAIEFANSMHIETAFKSMKTWGVINHPRVPYFHSKTENFKSWVRLQWTAMRAFSDFPFLHLYLSDGLTAHGKVEGVNTGRIIHFRGAGIGGGQNGGYFVTGNQQRRPNAFQVHLNRNQVIKQPNSYLWCQIIAHEMLHNMGFIHTGPTGQKNNFIEEFQLSIASKTPGSQLYLQGHGIRGRCDN